MQHSKFFSTLPAALLAMLLSITLGTACHKDDPVNPYTGVWELTFEGTCLNQQTVIINDNGSFAFSATCGSNVFSVEGQVDLDNGEMTGSLAWGPLYEPNALSGQINSNGTGSGNYNAFLGLASGGWIAIKK